MAIKDNVLQVLSSKMGPAAEPFLTRQCKIHLNKEMDQMVASDMPELAKWVKIGVGLTLGDEVANYLSEQILKIK